MNRFDEYLPKILLTIIILSIGFGVHARYTSIQYTVVDTPVRADALDYYFYAVNLKENHIYSRQNLFQTDLNDLKPDAVRSPGYPLFLSLFLSSDDISKNVKTVLWVQTIIQIASFLLLTLVLSKLLPLPELTVSTLLIWTFPHLVTINTYLLSESLFSSFAALILSSIGFFELAESIKVKQKFMISTGILIGLWALTRPVVEYLPIFLILVWLFSRKASKRELKPFITAAIAALVPIAIWKVRNFISIGSASDPSLMINGLYHGSFPGFMYESRPETFGFPYHFDPRADETSQGVLPTLQIIYERFLAEPALMTYWYLVHKIQTLWQWSIIQGQGDIFIYPIFTSPYLTLPELAASRFIHLSIHNIWVSFGIIGSIYYCVKAMFIQKEKSQLKLVDFASITTLYISILHVITAPFPRYNIPFKVILIIVSVVFLGQIIRSLPSFFQRLRLLRS